MTDIRQLQIAKGCVLYRATDFLSLAVSTFLVLIPGETSSVSSNFSQTSANFRRTSEMGNSQCGLVEVQFVGKRIGVEGFHVLETTVGL